MIHSLQERPVYSLDTFPLTSNQTIVNLDTGMKSRSKQLYTVVDSQLMIVNDKITSSVEDIVAFICKLHTDEQHMEQSLKNFELQLTDTKMDEQLCQLIHNCYTGLLKADDIGTGNFNLLAGYHLSIEILTSLSSFTKFIAQFHDMNKESEELFLKLGPSFDLLIPEIREKSQEFYKIKNALDLSWGFAEIKDSILQLANMQADLSISLTNKLQSIRDYNKSLTAGLKKLTEESDRFVTYPTNPLYIQRANEIKDEIAFLTAYSESMQQGLEIYDNLLHFLGDCQLQLHVLCNSIDVLETYYPLLVQSQLHEAGY